MGVRQESGQFVVAVERGLGRNVAQAKKIKTSVSYFGCKTFVGALLAQQANISSYT
jgi:hypothetical protein